MSSDDAVPHADERSEPLRIVLIESDEDWRMLAKVRLNLSEHFTVIGTCVTVREGLEVVSHEQPDVVLVGLGIPTPTEQDDVALLRSIAGDAKLVLASAQPWSVWAGRAERSIAAGVLDKMCIVALERELLEAIDEIDGDGDGVMARSATAAA